MADETVRLPAKYADARDEARRFLAAVGALEDRYSTDERFRRYAHITGGSETAAVKRASMDLTRSLARLRRAS